MKPAVHPRKGRGIIVLIGIGKLLKAALLILIGVEALRLVGHNVHDEVAMWVAHLRADPDNRYIHGLLEKLLSVTDAKLRLVTTGFFIYGGLYLTEGIGLILDQTWAEWMTIITTAGFVPLEIYEIVRHDSVGRVALLVVNVAILVYLIHRLRVKHWARVQMGAEEPG